MGSREEVKGRQPGGLDKVLREIVPLQTKSTPYQGFDLQLEVDVETVKRNRELLAGLGLLEGVEKLPYKRPFILGDRTLPATLDMLARTMAFRISYAKVMREREGKDTVPTEDPRSQVAAAADGLANTIIAETRSHEVPAEETLVALRKNFPYHAHFLQGLHYASGGDFEGADRCYEEANRILRGVDSVREVGPEGELSDRMTSLSHYLYVSPKVDLRKGRVLFTEALRKHDPEKSHYGTGIISDCISYVDFYLGRRGVDLIREWVDREDAAVGDVLSHKAVAGDEEGTRLAAHFEKNKRKVMEASRLVERQGTALVLAAGRMAVVPLADMLRERLPDGRVKYDRIALLDLSARITGDAVEAMVGRGEISAKEAKRVDVIEGDATLALKRLAKAFDAVVDPALKDDDLDSAVKGCLGILREVSDLDGLMKYVTPPEERPFKDGSVTFVVSSMDLSNFESGLVFYPNGLLSIFDKWVLQRGYERLKEEFRPITAAIADVVAKDAERMLAEGGIYFWSDATYRDTKAPRIVTLGMPPYLEKRVEELRDGRLYYFDGKLLPELIPTGCGFEVVDHDSWLRPVVAYSPQEAQRYTEKSDYTIESLTLRKRSGASYDPKQAESG